MASFYVVRSEPRYQEGADGKIEVRYLYEFLVADASVLANLPKDAYPGSRAFTADRGLDAMLDVDGLTWVNSVLVEGFYSGEARLYHAGSSVKGRRTIISRIQHRRWNFNDGSPLSKNLPSGLKAG